MVLGRMRFMFILFIITFYLTPKTMAAAEIPDGPSVVEILSKFSKTLRGDRGAFILVQALIDSDIRGSLILADDPVRRGRSAHYFRVTYMPPKIIRNRYWGFLKDSRLYGLLREKMMFESTPIYLWLTSDNDEDSVSHRSVLSHYPRRAGSKNIFIVFAPRSDSAVLASESVYFMSHALRIAWRVDAQLRPLVPDSKARQSLVNFVVELSSYAAAVREVNGFGHQPFLAGSNQTVRAPLWVLPHRRRISAEIQKEFVNRFAKPAEATVRDLLGRLKVEDFAKVVIALIEYVYFEDFRPLGLNRETKYLNHLVNCAAPLIPPNLARVVRR